MFVENDFVCADFKIIPTFTVSCTAPSNIALVKYWGKFEPQLPANPSLSFTLNNCHTATQIQFKQKENTSDFSFDFLFEGKPKESFKPKLVGFFKRIENYCPYLKNYHLVIDSKNTFPHSSGIASSASAMAAMSRAIMELEKQLNPTITEDFLFEKASFLARLGSGSACRSLKGEVVVWGKNKSVKNSSDLYGVPFGEMHSVFNNYQDTILLVDKGEKQVSSTVGHQLMENHPFAKERFAQAHENIEKLKTVLQNGDLDEFIAIVESEALTLHAMMMTSSPYFILMKPNTLEIINAIWAFRAETKTPLCFTLDAGANVHLLYPTNVKETVIQFVKTKLVAYCQNGQYICDELGTGSALI